MDKKSIIIIDDEESVAWVLAKTLGRDDLVLKTFQNGEQGVEYIQKEGADVCLIDINLPGMDGFEVMEQVKTVSPSTVSIIMTGQSTMKNTISAIQQGAFDYFSKPFDIDEVETIVGNALKESKRRKRKPELKAVGKDQFDDLIVGKSKAVHQIYKAIGKVSRTDLSVLIIGESGTGKELIARSLHENSDRKDKPFIAINCAAIPGELLESELFGHVKGAFTGANENRKGKFELAEGGTLFLDEIGDMPMKLQTKLLRVLQEKEFEPIGSGQSLKTNVRIVSATNKDLRKAIEDQKFREDLFFRLNVFMIDSPPLREREDDIVLLINHFLKKGAKDMLIPGCQISDTAMERMKNYAWPGNVRELENTVKSLMIVCSGSTIDMEHLPSNIIPSEHRPVSRPRNIETMLHEYLSGIVPEYCKSGEQELYDMVLKQVEKPLLEITLAETNWNQVKTAQILGMNRNTLRKKIKELDISKP